MVRTSSRHTGCGGSVSLLVRPRFTLSYFTWCASGVPSACFSLIDIVSLPGQSGDFTFSTFSGLFTEVVFGSCCRADGQLDSRRRPPVLLASAVFSVARERPSHLISVSLVGARYTAVGARPAPRSAAGCTRCGAETRERVLKAQASPLPLSRAQRKPTHCALTQPHPHIGQIRDRIAVL